MRWSHWRTWITRPELKSIALAVLLAALLSACDLGGGPPQGAATPTQAVGDQATLGSDLQGTLPPSVRACIAEDLKAVVGYQGAAGSMVGGVSFTNVSATSCAMEGRPGIHVTDARGSLMPVANLPFDRGAVGVGTPTAMPESRGPVIVKPGETAFVFFVWSNWCGQAQGPFTFAVALPGEGGQLNVPALDPEGKPLSDTPRCEQLDATSTISIGLFERR